MPRYQTDGVHAPQIGLFNPDRRHDLQVELNPAWEAQCRCGYTARGEYRDMPPPWCPVCQCDLSLIRRSTA